MTYPYTTGGTGSNGLRIARIDLEGNEFLSVHHQGGGDLEVLYRCVGSQRTAGRITTKVLGEFLGYAQAVLSEAQESVQYVRYDKLVDGGNDIWVRPAGGGGRWDLWQYSESEDDTGDLREFLSNFEAVTTTEQIAEQYGIKNLTNHLYA